MEHIKQDQIINIPNALTVVRILLLPVVVWRFVIGDATGALIAYLAAMLTDALDGIIARKFNQITALGKLLDPLADKLSLVTLLGLFVSDGQIPLWVLAIILVKEVTMVIGGGVALKRGVVVYALPIGKVTSVQNNPGSLYLDVVVEPFAHTESFEEVLVITSLTQEQQATAQDISEADAQEGGSSASTDAAAGDGSGSPDGSTNSNG